MRGYQKKVIFVKNTGSSIFEEAYFVLSPEGEAAPRHECDMVSEANRIIEENFGRKRRGIKLKHFAFIGAFFAGALFALCLSFIF